MNAIESNQSSTKSPTAYFLLTYVFTIPFWILGSLVNTQILPALPISAVAVLCPVAAAAVLVYRSSGRPGLADFLKRSIDFKRIRSKAWLLPLILLQPAIMALSFGVARLTGAPIPFPQFSFWTPLALFALFLVSAMAEELGWTGYATDPLQARFGALGAGLILGVAWAVWHFIPLLQANRSWDFIAWWSLVTVSSRVIIVWLYNNTGKSVFSAAVFHTIMNLTWQLYPIQGSFYDPRVTGPIVAVVAVIVALLWRPRTLTRSKGME